MSAREFFENISMILAVMAVGALLEVVIPMFVDAPWRRGRRAANLMFTALSFASNWALASISAIAALSWRPAGLMAQWGWPTWLAPLPPILSLAFSLCPLPPPPIL